MAHQPSSHHMGLLRFNRIIFRLTLVSGLLCVVDSLQLVISAISAETILMGVMVFIALALFPLLVLASQTRRLWPPSCWRTLYEILWLMFELTVVVGTSLFWGLILPRYDPGVRQTLSMIVINDPLYPITFLALGVLSFASLLLVIWAVFISHEVKIWRPYNGLQITPDNRWRVALGNDIFKKRYSTDNKIIQYARGIFALGLFLMIIVLCVYLSIMSPYNWRNVLESKTFKARIPDDFIAEWQEPIGNSTYRFEVLSVLVDARRLKHYLGADGIALEQALSVNVTRISPGNENTTRLACSKTSADNMVSCDTSQAPVLQEGSSVEISLDFSKAFPGASVHPSTYPHLPVKVYLGFVTSISSIYEDTESLCLFPGSRFDVFAEIFEKHKLTNERLATLGMPGKYLMYPFVGAIRWLPTSEERGLAVPLAGNTGSFRVFFTHSPTRLEKEYIGRSVLDGFAGLGGTWTFVNGIFAGIFGSTLLLVLFERKPLSAWGLVHSLQGGAVLHFNAETDIRLADPEKRRQVLELLCTHLLDTGDNKLKSESTTTPEPHGKEEADSDTASLLPHEGVVPISGSSTALPDEKMR